MKPIRLIIQKKWFDMIAKGSKSVEYREINKYYIHRFFDCRFMRIPDERLLEIFMGECNPSVEERIGVALSNKVTNVGWVELINGYQRNAPRLLIKVKAFSIGEGKQELGAVAGKRYFRLYF